MVSFKCCGEFLILIVIVALLFLTSLLNCFFFFGFDVDEAFVS